MDDSKKRWSVTFTKHIKQKTKVYKDGFLDLHISTNKVKLLDECEKLLECRILKNDEVVSSGETLTFNAYFVDVGDPQGDCKHIPDLSYQGRYKRKPVPGSLSPSHKMIREFKKRELQKYGTPRSSPEETKPRITEWQVLYTTQLTQKAKKYHDGFLQLATSGSLGRQIMLFDETRKLLDSRFLRRDEIIRSGESTAFDGHLVEIGECEEKDGPPMGLNVEGNNGNVAGKSEVMHGHRSCTKTDKYDGKEFKKIEVPGCGAAQGSLDTTNSNITEWQVMYTTQVTQKAKKYHDGFLRLAVTGSLQRQVMLYDDGRKLLNSRFLKQDEKIISGESIAFDAHLVDIGEPQESHQIQMGLNVQENIGNVVRRTGIKLGKRNCLKADDSVVKGKPQNAACSWENADSSFSISSVEDVKVGKSVPTSKPLRNAVQIMSILQKPKAPGSVDAGCTGNSFLGQLSSTKMLEVSDTVVAVMGDGQLPAADPGSYNYIDTVRSNEETDIATSTGSGSQISRGTEIENFDQSHLDVKGCGKGHDETSGLGIMRAGTSNGPGHGERNNSQEPKSESKMDEFPSFNLGF